MIWYLGIVDEKLEDENIHYGRQIKEEEVVSNKAISEDDLDNNIINPVNEEQPVVVDLGNEGNELDENDIIENQATGDFKGYVNFGDGNVNLFKDLSQNTFKNNFLKKKREQAKTTKVDKVDNKKKEDKLFEFVEPVDKNDVFKKKNKAVKVEEKKDNMFKKRKLIKFFHVDQTM